ncbi:MAG: hypothetical protein ABI557_19190, partial [Aureliella sp.]
MAVGSQREELIATDRDGVKLVAECILFFALQRCLTLFYALLPALGRAKAGMNPRTPKLWSAATCRSFGLAVGSQREELIATDRDGVK